MRIWRERIYTLAYTDDVVILAEGEEEMKELMKRLEKYIEEKKLIVNVEESKNGKEER